MIEEGHYNIKNHTIIEIVALYCFQVQKYNFKYDRNVYPLFPIKH